MQGRKSSVGHLQARIPSLVCTESCINDYMRWAKAMLYKHGPKHDLDLVDEDLARELKFARSPDSPTTNRRQDLYSSPEYDPGFGDDY